MPSRKYVLPALMAVSACSNVPTQASIGPSPIFWRSGVGASWIYEVGTTRDSKTLYRCWLRAEHFDCLMIFWQDLGDAGMRYQAKRYRTTRLAKTDEEVLSQVPEVGYACDISTKLGLATESVAEQSGESNNVSLIGEEPIGKPLTPKYVNDIIGKYHRKSSLYFDCIELGGVLIAGELIAATTNKINPAQLMPL